MAFLLNNREGIRKANGWDWGAGKWVFCAMFRAFFPVLHNFVHVVDHAISLGGGTGMQGPKLQNHPFIRFADFLGKSDILGFGKSRSLKREI